MTRKTENYDGKLNFPNLALNWPHLKQVKRNSSALKSAADMCCRAFQVALKAGGSNLVDTAAGT